MHVKKYLGTVGSCRAVCSSAEELYHAMRGGDVVQDSEAFPSPGLSSIDLEIWCWKLERRGWMPWWACGRTLGCEGCHRFRSSREMQKLRRFPTPKSMLCHWN